MDVKFVAMADESENIQLSDDDNFPTVATATLSKCNKCIVNTLKRGALCTVVTACILATVFGVYKVNVPKKSKQCPESCQLGGFDTPNPSLLDYGKSILDVKFFDTSIGNSSQERCCPDIGCFDKGYPFDVLPFPECVNVSNIHFTLFKGDQPMGEIKYDGDIPAGYSGRNQTIFIIHGYQSGGNSSWIHKMADALMTFDPQVDVIVVDWRHYASRYFYSQSASNTRAIGAYTALIINRLVLQRSISYSSIWCIGHSLGAHACGYAGLSATGRFGHKIGRITGLDPAGPCFECQDSTDIGLNENCAKLVDIVHTDTSGVIGNFGTKRPLGHVDFYPNGRGNQPGCQTRKRKRRSAVSCSHSRAYQLFIEAINQPGSCVASQHCVDVDEMPGSCTKCQEEECPVLGFHQPQYSDQTSSVYYMNTRARAPYCQS